MLAPVIAELLACYGELRRYLTGSLRHPDDAADVAQASFLQAYAHALTSPIDCPRALLYRTAHNLCVDRARRAATDASTLKTWALLQPDEAPCAERTIVAQDELQRVISRLMAMPRLRREVFVLVRVYGHRHAEVAARLDLSLAAVEKHVVRATLDLARLATALERAHHTSKRSELRA